MSTLTLDSTIGLSVDEKDQGPHKLRRSHASWLAAGGGDAVKALGHSSGYTTERSYLDPAIGLKPVALFRPWEDEDGSEDVA